MDDYYWPDQFRKRVHQEAIEAEQHGELQNKFESWGFSPTVDKYVQDLIEESGYWVTAKRGEDGVWSIETRPKNDGKFDLASARKALDEIDARRRDGVWGLYCENKDLLALADKVCSVARTSLEKHGNLRDAVNAMGDYELRDRSHPNASKRDDLRRVLHHYVSAREEYKDEVDQRLAVTVDDAIWFDERIKQFQNVAAEYVDTPNAHTKWLTSQISAWLLRPRTEILRQGATQSFLTERPGFVTDFIRGIGWKKPWRSVVPFCISALLLLLSVALVVGCYVLLTPLAAYVAAGLCGLLYARRYFQARRFRKERERVTRLWHKVSALHNEVESGRYNAEEIIRRFREIEADDLLLPSIFVSVIALPEVQPASA